MNTAGTASVGGKDQRGITRPQPTGGHCDIGAFEYVFTPTTTVLTVNPNPAAFGQTITFTATITGIGGTPTGSVTFKDGTTVIGGGTLFSGVATFTTSILTAGGHSITAIYSGDATFSPSAAQINVSVGPLMNPLPVQKAGGSAGGVPNPLPVPPDPAGTSSGTKPNVLPPARP